MSERHARYRFVGIALALAIVVGACGSQPTASPTSGGSPTPRASASASPAVESADFIFTDANVVTMDDGHPSAQAVAVKGDTIMAVGTTEEIAKLQGPSTGVVSLAGKTLVPGFTDTHQHRIGDGPTALGLEPKALIDAAIEQGYTTIDELYVDQGRLDQLRDLDQSGVLRLRVNAYLPVQENSAEGKLLGDYFDAYQQGQTVSPHVRVAGLKVFTDFANATILLWKQADLNDFLLKQHEKGWHFAVKTVSTRSLAMIIKAFQSIQAADPRVVDSRGRLEHTLFATASQIGAIKSLGLVPIINLNNPGQLVGEPDVAALIATEPKGSYVPWRSMFDAGIAAAGMSGFPSFYVEEPKGAPFGSPIHLIYQGVTRAGNLGAKSPTALLGEALTADQAMRAMTINAARAGWEDDVKGSITTGKLADLVVLAGDPLSVPARQINGIDVLMTMIGGKVEWCAPGSEAVCPVPGSGGGGGSGTPAPGPTGGVVGSVTVTASAALADNPPTNAIDGDPSTTWDSGAPPEQWIQLDLGSVKTMASIRLVVAQAAAGGTVHQLWIGSSESDLGLVREFKGITSDGQELTYTFPGSQADFRIVRIVTTQGSQPVAWREIELVTP
jgi:predicted amidohydrolase YtcJ